jgi:hypothetical protein
VFVPPSTLELLSTLLCTMFVIINVSGREFHPIVIAQSISSIACKSDGKNFKLSGTEKMPGTKDTMTYYVYYFWAQNRILNGVFSRHHNYTFHKGKSCVFYTYFYLARFLDLKKGSM